MFHRHAVFPLAVTALVCFIPITGTSQSVSEAGPASPGRPTPSDAQHLFYNANYEAAAAVALEVRASDENDLSTYELRTSALLFQLKRLLKGQGNRSEALRRCETCPALVAAFLRDTETGQMLARARLRVDPDDDEALFFLSKLDLNYVWLQLDTLGKKKGWDEFREARRCLGAVLKRNPQHVRARVARAWIEYIVDTRMPRGTRWLFGGGDKDRALTIVREAAEADADFFVHAEAVFALWEMQLRERRIPDAVDSARGLARDFPENRQIAEFLETHDSTFQR